jgi:hypothetical protein
MATVTETRANSARIGEHRIVIRDVGWSGYQSLLKMIGDQRVRVTYDRGDAELLSPHSEHERYAVLFAHMIITITDELDISYIEPVYLTWSDCASRLSNGLASYDDGIDEAWQDAGAIVRQAFAFCPSEKTDEDFTHASD